MRLKTRILLCASALLIAAVTVCCVVILRIVHDQLKDEAMTAAKADFSDARFPMPHSMFSSQDRMIEDSYMLHFVRSSDIADELTLKSSDRYLMNNTGFAPEPYLFSDDAEDPIRTCYARVFGTLYLMAGEKVYLHEQPYTVCLVRNMSKLDQTVHDLALRCLLVGGSITAVFLLLTYLFLSLSLKPIRKLQTGARAIASGDYSARIAIRRKDEIGLLAEDFNVMASAVDESIQALQEQNLRKQQFINDLSHEMKTPVTSLLLNSETLTMRNVSEDDAQHALYRIHEQAKWIETLSRKLMMLVMLQDKIELVPCSLDDLFDSVELHVHDSLNSASISLKVRPSDAVFSMDFDLMQSALVNLIENAIKASEPGSRIELFCEDRAIVVHDHGCGIPPAEIHRITEPFYMVDRSRSKKLGGSGLGLALVQRIAELHHAELTIESEVGIGTSIFFRFSDAI